jgi:hypothetical protein
MGVSSVSRTNRVMTRQSYLDSLSKSGIISPAKVSTVLDCELRLLERQAARRGASAIIPGFNGLAR